MREKSTVKEPTVHGIIRGLVCRSLRENRHEREVNRERAIRVDGPVKGALSRSYKLGKG
jgi:hypothetical protein